MIANGDPGARMRLSDLQGKVVILDFWASWCEPCAIQGRILDKIARQHPDDLVVLGINVEEEPALARRHAEAQGVSYPILSDPEGEVQVLYSAHGLPALVVVSPDGTVVKVKQGLASGAEIDQALKRARRTGS